jgi:pimeloyl-ACP methyl ester carboxylesterase
MTEPDRFPGRSERLPSMAPPRILLCPQFSEVEWAIAPQLSEWAEIATFDAPGVGNEPVPEQGPQLLDRETVVRRALRELDRRGWDSCFVAGDAFGTATAARVAAERPEAVRGIALGHASLHYETGGARPAVNGEVVAAMTQLLRTDYDSFVSYGITQFTQGGFDDEMATEMVRRFPSSEITARVWETLVAEPAPIGELLRPLDQPLLFTKHDGCLVFTAEGYEDAVGEFPEAEKATMRKPSGASEEFAGALRRFCERVGA